MKMNKISALALGLLASAALFTGCTKDLETSTVTGLTATGTLKGYVYLDIDQSGKNKTWETKAGITVRAYYTPKDLAYKADDNALDIRKVVTTTTAADGSYSLTVPATDKGTTVTVEVALIELANELKINKPTADDADAVATLAKAYFIEKDGTELTVKKDVTKMVPTYYFSAYQEITTERAAE